MKRLFKVSTKAAIYDSTNERVLLIHMDRSDDWGLPGGHIDEGETPDIAMARELYEECGVIPTSLTHKDFFMHSNGKLILAYVCQINDDKIKSQQNEHEGVPKWVSLDDFKSITIEPNYRD